MKPNTRIEWINKRLGRKTGTIIESYHNWLMVRADVSDCDFPNIWFVSNTGRTDVSNHSRKPLEIGS